MRIADGKTLYSASDLVNFIGCRHATVLDLRQLISPIELPPESEQMALLQEKGIEHERRYLQSLTESGRKVTEIPANGELSAKVARTAEAIRGGADVIYQGALFEPPWHGFSDFLLRVSEPSAVGDWTYEVADTKLARSAKPSHVLQLCVYAGLLQTEQGRVPPRIHVVLGNGEVYTLRTEDVLHYYGMARKQFEAFVRTPPADSMPEPCGHCGYCRWQSMCEAEWERTDHLSLVAGIARSQRDKLRAAGIGTLRPQAPASAPWTSFRAKRRPWC